VISRVFHFVRFTTERVLVKITCLNCVQGLEINANHWPCLDHVITVLYAVNNYEGKI